MWCKKWFNWTSGVGQKIRLILLLGIRLHPKTSDSLRLWRRNPVSQSAFRSTQLLWKLVISINKEEIWTPTPPCPLALVTVKMPECASHFICMLRQQPCHAHVHRSSLLQTTLWFLRQMWLADCPTLQEDQSKQNLCTSWCVNCCLQMLLLHFTQWNEPSITNGPCLAACVRSFHWLYQQQKLL